MAFQKDSPSWNWTAAPEKFGGAFLGLQQKTTWQVIGGPLAPSNLVFFFFKI